MNTKTANDELIEHRQSERFLDVFVIRSFRESHMPSVMSGIQRFIEGYQSAYWKSKPYRIVDTAQEITSGRGLREEITRRIENAAITFVILDGLRHNILFELGYLQASKRPFALFKHQHWGPQFIELDLLASDLKGAIVKEFDHEREDDFQTILQAEFTRCEREFLCSLGTDTVISLNEDNLTKLEWAFETDVPGDETRVVFQNKLNRIF
jgi:hypothetical protein